MTNYEINTGLAEPVPADPAVSGIWGTIWNNNATKTGNLTSNMYPLNCAGSSNIVLTFTNGAPDQVNNAGFLCTGVLTGNIVVLLAQSKTKGATIVNNQCTGAFSLAFGVNNGSGAAAGATVTIPQGTTAIIWSDGTNVLSAITTFANPTFTGTCTFPDGGTWTTAGISGLTNLSVLNNSGTSDLGDFKGTYNGALTSRFDNLSTGNAAYSGVNIENSAHGLYLRMLGTGFTPAGNNTSDQAQLITDGGGGILFGTLASAPVGVIVAGAKKWFFDSDGSLHSVSATAPGSESFTAAGNIAAGGAITAVGNITSNTSDMRLKQNFEAIEKPLKLLSRLEGFYFDFNSTGLQAGLAPGRHVGLSAQSVRAIMPEAVARAPLNDWLDKRGIDTPAEPYMTVNYADLVPLLVEGIKAQQGQIFWMRAGLIALTALTLASMIWR